MTDMKKTTDVNQAEDNTLDLGKIREEIDEIDTQIADLFNSRMQKSLQVAEYKQSRGLPVFNNAREKDILHRISEQIGEPFDGYARVVFNTIMDVSKSCQYGCLDSSNTLSPKIRKAIDETPSLFPKKAVVACRLCISDIHQLLF